MGFSAICGLAVSCASRWQRFRYGVYMLRRFLVNCLHFHIYLHSSSEFVNKGNTGNLRRLDRRYAVITLSADVTRCQVLYKVRFVRWRLAVVQPAIPTTKH
jgi:hypothetical protein